jgi:hypothetical protein
MKRKIVMPLAAAAVIAAAGASGYAFAKLEGYSLPQWESKSPIPYVTGSTPPGWILNDRFGLWTAKTCKFGEVETQCSYTVTNQDAKEKEVKR